MLVHTGDYVEHVSSDITSSTYYTFTPLPLMMGVFHVMNDDLALLLAETHRLLGVLEGMAYLALDRDALVELFLIRESCFSKIIDYPDFDIRAMLARRSIGNSDYATEGITTAYLYAIGVPASKLSYRRIINYALHGNDPKRKVGIRSNPLFWKQSTSNYHQYNPTAPDNIHKALNDITMYINSSNIDTFIKAAMCHYQFEMIHPFDCYNGIAGRILAYHIIANDNLNGLNFCSLSSSLLRHKAEYFDKLGSTQKNGNYSVWIEFFIRVINEAARHGIDFIRYYEVTARQEEEKINTRHLIRADNTLDVYRYFKRNIVSSIGNASDQLKFSFDTVSRSIGILQDMGILVQINHGARNRLFAHNDIMRRMTSPEER
jgi:Fic family protein